MTSYQPSSGTPAWGNAVWAGPGGAKRPKQPIVIAWEDAGWGVSLTNGQWPILAFPALAWCRQTNVEGAEKEVGLLQPRVDESGLALGSRQRSHVPKPPLLKSWLPLCSAPRRAWHRAASASGQRQKEMVLVALSHGGRPLVAGTSTPTEAVISCLFEPASCLANSGAMPSKYSHISLSVTDLYAEQDRLSGAYRTIALVASWFVLGAYILAPLLFTSASDNLKPTRNAMVALAVAMLVVGYVALAATAVRSRSLLFCLECVALPTLTSSVAGLFAVVMNHALHKVFPVSDTYIVVPLVLVCISVVASGLWAAYLYRRIHRIKRSSGGRGRPVPLTFQEPYPSPGIGYLSPGMGDSSSTQGLLPHQQQFSRG